MGMAGLARNTQAITKLDFSPIDDPLEACKMIQGDFFFSMIVGVPARQH